MISTSKLWPFGSKVRKLPATVRPTTAAAERILGPALAPAPGSDSDAVPSWPVTDDPEADDQVDVATTTRKNVRYVPLRPHTTLLDERGKRHGARIINLSSTGVAVEADFKLLNPNDVSHVGATRVKAGRRIQRGMVFIFDKPLDPKRCSESTTL